MISRKITNLTRSALLLSITLGVGCQKKADAPAACGSSVAGAATSSGGASASAGSAPIATGGAGGTSAGGSVNLGSGGTAAAAATSGADSMGGTGGTAGAPASLATCGQLSVADCATGMDCQALSGQPISGNPPCLAPFQVVACSSNAIACSPVATRATDLNSHDWVFPSTCIPAGWVNSSSSGTRFDACTPPPSDADAGTN